MKKLNIEFIREEFQQCGYTLLEEKYINCETKMRYTCRNHPEQELWISYHKLKAGRRCPYCSVKRLTFKKIKEEFEKKGYDLVEQEYKTSQTPMRYKCPIHPNDLLQIRYRDLKKGRGCPKCAVRRLFERVKYEFVKRGYTLLENEYVNNKTKMRFRCSKHPDKVLYTTFNSLQRGQGCYFCGRVRLQEKQKMAYDDVRAAFEKQGYQLLEQNYINARQKLLFRCPKHPEKKLLITYADMSQGHGCAFCKKEKLSVQSIGEKNNSWKGGVQTLNRFLRKNLKEWKRQSLQQYNYKCFVTNTHHKDLQIHHAKPFHVIRDEILGELGLLNESAIAEYPQDVLDLILEQLKERHTEIGGVPLRKEVHKLFHALYGITTTMEQLLEFKDRYNAGEFIATKVG